MHLARQDFRLGAYRQQRLLPVNVEPVSKSARDEHPKEDFSNILSLPWLRWLRKKKQDNAASDNVVIEGLFPWLPSASHGPRSTPSQQDCWLFSLPAELRRKILEEAFGNCTIHIDLRLQPISRMPCRTLSSPHGGDAPLVEEEGNRPAVRSKTWKWYGCVCHRNKPPQPRLAQQTSLYLYRCLYGEGICDAWPGEAPGKCCIGMMGIMLSCKQAHDEVLGVIYSTNTIHIASEPLVQALLQRGLRDSPRVTGPGIGLVTSLEIKWRFDLFSDSIDRVCTEHRRRFTQSLQLLPQAFPGLSRLTLAFEDRLYYKRLRPSDNVAEVECILLKSLLSAATSLKLRSFDVEVPHSLFDEFRLVGNMECGEVPEGSKWNYWGEWIRYPFIRERDNDASYQIKRGEMSNIGWYTDGRCFLFSNLLHGF